MRWRKRQRPHRRRNGKDTLIGGFGDDTFIVEGTGPDSQEGSPIPSADADIVVEHAGGGIDTVLRAREPCSFRFGRDRGSVTLTMPPAMAALNLTGSVIANAITGNAGANMLAGLAGNDALFGLSGNDVLKGGLGKDTLTGGAGKDAFVFDTAPNTSANVDMLADFSVNGRYRLARQRGPEGGRQERQAREGCLLPRQEGADAEDRIVYDKASGALSYDADGSGKIAAIKLAVLRTRRSSRFRISW